MFPVSSRTLVEVRPLHGVALLQIAAALLAAAPCLVHASEAKKVVPVVGSAPKPTTTPVPAMVVAATKPTAVRTLPVLSVQPQSTTVLAGRPATFTVVAASASNLTYQWMRGTAKIVGATSSTYIVPATALADSGASFTVTVKNLAGAVTSSVARLTVNAVATAAATADRPFNDQSPWNSRPGQFTLGTYQIPTSSYFPAIEEGAYSTGAFVASASDPAVTVKGSYDGSDIYVPDAEASSPQIVIAHWPAGVTPASGSDGHADIIDPTTNRIHSFYQLSLVNGQWRASQYTWTALDGRGFGTPAQYQQGARAAGVVPSAGLIRKSEVNDGLPSYRHALAMSLTFNALAKSPTYVFPATNSDSDAATTNSGAIPEGALMMLPADFDASQVTNPKLLKIVRTLQSFGAYVVDRNYGTPYVIYAEIGSHFDLMPNGWDTDIANQLELIRIGLRQVTSTTAWLDAKGAAYTPDHRLNLLSMRGYWYVIQGTAAGVFDTQQQAVVFPGNGVQTIQVNAGPRSMPNVFDAPVVGKPYTMKVKAMGGATMKFDLTSSGVTVYSTGVLADGATVTFNWPANGLVPYVWAYSAATGGGTVSGTITAVNP